MPGRVIARAEPGEACDVRPDDGVRIAGHRRRRRRERRRVWRGLRADCREMPRASIRVPRSRSCRCGAACARRCRPAARADADRPRPATVAAISVDQIVVRRQHRPVSRFERRDLVEQREVGVERHLAAIEEQQVVEREEHARFAQARGDVEDVAAGAAAPPGAAPRSSRRRRGALRGRCPGKRHDTSSPMMKSGASGCAERNSRQPSMVS